MTDSPVDRLRALHQLCPDCYADYCEFDHDWIACVVGKREAEIIRLRERAKALATAADLALRGRVINNWLTGGDTICLQCGQLPDSGQHDDGCWVAEMDAALRAYREGGCPGCSFRRQTGGNHDDVPTGDADPNCPYREGS